MARPRTASGTSDETRWLGTRWDSWSNHHNDIRVRISPLSGIGVSRTKSKAEMRSLATTTGGASGSSSPDTGSPYKPAPATSAGVEPREVPRRGRRHLDAVDLRVRRPAPAPVDQRGDRVRRPGEVAAHRA